MHSYDLEANGMATNLVNLDALIPREDFEEVSPEIKPVLGKKPEGLRLSDLDANRGITYGTLRKPDFQRETASWDPTTVAEFIQSFVAGDLIPSVILWRSPETGNIFVIDGGHRLSALIGWIRDDYGDKEMSVAFFENIIAAEQERAAVRTRSKIKKLVGSYGSLQSAFKYPDNADPEVYRNAKNADFFTIPILWVEGDAKKAEDSFYRINLKAVAIDPTEVRMIKARHKPSALAARAIVRAGTGHQYWAAFPVENQEKIRKQAKSIYDILFVPALETVITTGDLPIAGRSYAGGESLGLVFNFVSIASGLHLEATKKLVKKGRKKKGEVKEDIEADDNDGLPTLTYLGKVYDIAERLSGHEGCSLGSHPAVYFYGITGRFQPTAFLATVGLIQDLAKKKAFDWFTEHRAKFEEFLLRHRHFTNQIVSKFGGQLRSYPSLLKYYQDVLRLIADGRSFTEIELDLAANGFSYLKDRPDYDEETTGSEFSKAVKTLTTLREAIKGAYFCNICHARINQRSISYDHVEEKRKGGKGNPSNAQMVHHYCNGYKDRGGKTISPLPSSL